MKIEFQNETESDKKKEKMNNYISKQKEIKELAINEESERVMKRFEKMRAAGVNGFWKERKRMTKDESSSWFITKDNEGKRIFDAELNKENIANYFETLYKCDVRMHHPYHTLVEEKIGILSQSAETDSDPYGNDRMPTKTEIKEVINRKKNGKATTDWKNELLKKGGDEMVDFVFPVIKAFWREEIPPKQWNAGLITSVWKGKGDRERLMNHRGITVSSSIGTIAEEIIFNRVSKVIQFTQAQAGGKKDGSTADHVFILRNIITIAMKEKREILVTFYDVAKAYDRADMNDMLVIMNEGGVSGKLWRLMKALNENLTAKINTKVGLTREIRREMGGKQGGKLMVSLFAKLMDQLAVDLMAKEDLGIAVGEAKINAQLFVDDAISYAEGYTQQELTLSEVNDFAVRHKLEWGAAKCKTMEIGNKKEKRSSWTLGEKQITKCSSYKYLGEIIMRNGKNNENIKERMNKMKNAVRAIVTCCRNKIMERVGTRVACQLHEAVTLPSLLYNAETWSLNKTEKGIFDRAEIYAWKQMIGLPKTTPTAGIVLTVGSLFTSIRIEMKQLLYLHKVLQKNAEHWARVTLLILWEREIGWAKQLKELLIKWGLESDRAAIQRESTTQWKIKVKQAAEKQNKERLREECETKIRGEIRQKTKTKFVETSITHTEYQRELDPLLAKHQSIKYAKLLIMARYGMLDCANNYASKYGGKLCNVCKVIDDENHRINWCKRLESINLYNGKSKADFQDIYSRDESKCLHIVEIVASLWDLESGKNEMRM